MLSGALHMFAHAFVPIVEGNCQDNCERQRYLSHLDSLLASMSRTSSSLAHGSVNSAGPAGNIARNTP